jgi:NAD(P)-dependent dehydrogenase (short-subunit alcohol dehydrogenase family)
MKIQHSVAFVTGANRGLGLAFARELLKRGAKVYAGMRNTDGFDVPGLIPVQIDVTDPASVVAAAALCADTTLLVNNAGIARLLPGALAAEHADVAREIFETNYFGVLNVSSAFAPLLGANGGGAIVNVLSDAVWLARPFLAAYAASKAAAWSLTNATRIELRAQHTLVQGIHVGFLDTDMTSGFDMTKTPPLAVVRQSLDGVEAALEEVLADEGTIALKASLSGPQAAYFNPAEIA